MNGKAQHWHQVLKARLLPEVISFGCDADIRAPPQSFHVNNRHKH